MYVYRSLRGPGEPGAGGDGTGGVHWCALAERCTLDDPSQSSQPSSSSSSATVLNFPIWIASRSIPPRVVPPPPPPRSCLLPGSCRFVCGAAGGAGGEGGAAAAAATAGGGESFLDVPDAPACG